MDDTLHDDSSAIPARIDRLPVSREIWRIILLAGIAWLLESYDIGVVGTILPSLKRQFDLSTSMVALLAVVSTIGIVVAVFPAGWLADRFGRKKVLLVGTIWYALFSFACAFAPNPTMIAVLRFISGFGMGAIFPIPYAMAAEFTPSSLRGTATGILDAFLSVGYFAAPLLGFAFAALLPAQQSWRILLMIGGIPILFAPILYKWMPESPRWLQSRGRAKEADQIVNYLETAVEKRTGTTLPYPQAEEQTVTESATPPSTLFSHAYLKRTLMMWVAFACILFIFYVIQTYTPTLLVSQGYALGNAFLMTTIIVIASIPGKFAAAYALERWGRKPTLIGFTLIAALAAIIFGLVHNAILATLFGAIMSFFGIGVDPAIKIYGAEQYPTRIRAMGISAFEGVGRLFGGVLAPYIMAFSLASGGTFGSYVFVAAIACCGVIAVAFFGNETRGQSLEKASASQTVSTRTAA
jgi:putative MFS transporter